MKYNTKYFFALAITFAIATTSVSQGLGLVFHSIDEKDGLSDNFVNCFLKDRSGNIWVGTNNGLNLYDGAHFQVFRKSKDTSSLINNAVHSLCEDKTGNIWGGTNNGVFCYLIKEKRFRRYLLPQQNNATAALNIVYDRNGDIWASSFLSLFKFNWAKNAIERIGELHNNPDSVSAYGLKYNGLLDDPSGKGLWIASRAGMHYYDKSTGKYTSHRTEPGNPLFMRRNMAALSASSNGHYYFFDYGTKEIIRFNPATRTIINRISVKKEMPNAIGSTIYESGDGKLWLSSWTNELLVIDPTDHNKIYKFSANENDRLSIKGNFFWAAMEDTDGTIWFGTNNGISKCNQAKSLYRIHDLPAELKDFTTNTSIDWIAEHPDGESWWLANGKFQVARYFPKTQQYRLYTLNNNLPDRQGHNFPGVVVFRFVNGNIIFCTHIGSWKFDTTSGKVTPFEQLPKPFQSYVVKDITPGGNGHYFVNDGQQILDYDIEKHSAVAVTNPSAKQVEGKTLINSFITKKNPWPLWSYIGKNYIAYLDSGNLQPVKLFEEDEETGLGYFTRMDIDPKGKVWLSNSGEGLFSYDPSTRKAKHWNQSNGLINDFLSSVVADNYGNIWSGARNDYSVFVQQTEQFYNFKLPMSGINTSWNSQPFMMLNGNILSNGYNQIVEFFPDRLNLKPALKMPSVSGVQIGNTQRIIGNDTLINLEPYENTLTIQFGLQTDNELFPYAYYYRLDGAEKEWTITDNRPEARYNNLPSGNYVLRIKAIAKNNTWQSYEKKFYINIRTPFYKSWPFFILIFLMLLCGFYLFYRFRLAKQQQIHKLESKAQALEKEKTIIQYEGLKQQLNPHFLFNSLTSLRSLIKTNSKAAAGFLDGMSKIYRYVLKSGAQELVLLQDEIEFVKTFTDLQQVRFGEGLQVDIHIDEEAANRFIAPVVLQNMVENAIKHNTTSTDEPLLIEIYAEADHIVIRNTLQRYRIVETSNKSGLASLKKLYSFYTDKPIEILEDEHYFTVRIPLL